MFTAGVTLQVWRPPAADDDAPVDAHGNRDTRPVRAESADEEFWALAPPSALPDSAEPDEANRDELVDVLMGYREDLETDLRADDEVTVDDGDRYRVVGKPAIWRDQWDGTVLGSTIRLENVSG